MKKNKDEERPRNWVHKAVVELGLKPSKHKDRKHDYDRAHRRKLEREWDEADQELSDHCRKRKRKKRLWPNKDRGRDREGELDSLTRLQQDEDSPDAEEV